jgi:REP element-mobilizing transposase RayT
MSRVIQRQMLLGDAEKEYLRVLLRQVEDFCGVRVLDYAILTNHFHIEVQVPVCEEVGDQELIRRVRGLYGKDYARELERRLAELREAGEDQRAEALRKKFTYRMYDVSEFMKTLKQRFTQWYNRRNGRKGTLWEERFKSVLVEGRTNALRTVAAYIDLNPVRAGMAEDPKDYRYCGYGEAVAGDERARAGLAIVMGEVAPDGDWARVSRAYRQTLFEQGISADGKKGLDPAKVREVLAAQGELSLAEALRCRVRYFSDGVVLGTREFVDAVFQSHRHEFGLKRTTGARAMRFGAWNGLCTMRDLRQIVVSVSG